MYNLNTMYVPRDFPSFDEHFFELNQFILQLVDSYNLGKIDSWEDLESLVNSFFTRARMDQMEALVPGWRKMASYRNGVTLIHVMCVFLGLYMLPEFKSLPLHQQGLMKWVILFHDIEKEIRNGKRDPTHAFRSAVTTAKRLPAFGFATTNQYQSFIESWDEFTSSAFIRTEDGSEPIQDNLKYPEILSGVERLFGKASPAALIVETILFHMSVNVVKDWPQAAPLSDEEITKYMTKELLPLLKAIMLADSEGWVMFYPEDRAKQREQTLDTFDWLDGLIS